MNRHESRRQTPHGRGGSSVDAACRVALLRAHTARGCARLPRRVGGFLLAGLALLGGCTWSTITVESGAPPDPAALSRIRLGETTGTEVMRLLGPPHSIIRGSARIYDVGDRALRHGSSIPEYYSYARERQLSSLDDEHYALFYKYWRETRSDALLIARISKQREVRFQGEELLIILDNEKDVVTDVGFPLDDSSP